jgi:alkanesulfonate monooxygenase SsuD/methylene tetrahydromethanopterin reductase-like flavin-dependent oxidoreductase (luciferase family)
LVLDEAGISKADIAFGLQANVSVDDIAPLAAQAEQMGFERVLVADHPGLTDDPFVALAAAASHYTRSFWGPM